jgi:hypothetical protein
MIAGALALALFLAAAATNGAPGDKPPPLINGVYVEKGACPGEGCDVGPRLKSRTAIAVYAEPSPKAKIVGKLRAGEWVRRLDQQMHLVPMRGVVEDPAKQGEQLAKGDIVYALLYQGEGCFDLWRRGARLDWCEPESMGSDYATIRWDARAPTAPPDVFWIKIRRAKGGDGWIKDLSDVQCLSRHDNEGCPS